MAGKKEVLNEKHIIRIALIESRSAIKAVAEKLGIKGTTISNQLGRKDSTLTLTTFFSILDVLGYEIVVRKKENPDSEYKLENICNSTAEWDKKVVQARVDEEIRQIDEKAEIVKLKSKENAAAMRESMKK